MRGFTSLSYVKQSEAKDFIFIMFLTFYTMILLLTFFKNKIYA